MHRSKKKPSREKTGTEEQELSDLEMGSVWLKTLALALALALGNGETKKIDGLLLGHLSATPPLEFGKKLLLTD